MKLILVLFSVFWCVSPVVVVNVSVTNHNPNKEVLEAQDNKETRREYVLKTFLPFLRYCGIQHSDGYYHDLDNIDIHEYPWLVHLDYSGYSAHSSKHKCAGVLISDNLVLTVGVCGSYYISGIRIGQHDLYNSTSCANATEYGQAEECTDPVIITSGYRQVVKKTYMMLMRLDQKIQFTDYVRPICLPFEESQRPTVGATVYTSGWGEENDGKGSNKLVKKKLDHEILSFEDDGYLGNGTQISFGKKDSSTYVCKGDEGGPLMYRNRKHQWFLAGIVQTTPCKNKTAALAYRITSQTLENLIDPIYDFLVH